MQTITFQNRGLYLLMAALSAFLVFAALGPGLYAAGEFHFFHWEYLLFQTVCHQDPLRSYTLNGVQMAVCARCLGIYGLLLTGWVLMPAAAKFSITSKKWGKQLFGIAILLNLADVIGNYFGLWTNSLNSRFLLGSLLGLSITLFLVNEFFKQTKPED